MRKVIIEDLMDRHNQLVKEKYACRDIDLFTAWVNEYGSFTERYIEIASNETKSRHAERLEW